MMQIDMHYYVSFTQTIHPNMTYSRMRKLFLGKVRDSSQKLGEIEQTKEYGGKVTYEIKVFYHFQRFYSPQLAI